MRAIVPPSGTKATMSERNNILAVLPVLGDARHTKRVGMLQRAGFHVRAIAFEREYYEGRLPDCELRVLGRLSHGNYAQRIAIFLRNLPKVRTEIKKADLVYAFGPDMAFMCLMAGAGLGIPVVFEIGDIRWIQTAPGLKGRLVRLMDRAVVKGAKLVVATASGYVEEYYGKWVGSQIPSLIIENKQEPQSENHRQPPAGSPRTAGSALTIGFFGLLRCAQTWEHLKALAAARPDIRIVMAGIVFEPIDLIEQARAYSNIDYLGLYKSPDDLPRLYGQVDIVWACYPFPEPGDQNWRWARTNRFYESLFYRRPVIALKDSGDSVAVRNLSIGMLLDHANRPGNEARLNALQKADIAVWKTNVDQTPEEVYTYTTETQQLRAKLSEIVQHKEQPLAAAPSAKVSAD